MTDHEIVCRLVNAIEAEIDNIKASGTAVLHRHTYSAAISIMAERVIDEEAAETRDWLIEDLTSKLRTTVKHFVDVGKGRVQ